MSSRQPQKTVQPKTYKLSAKNIWSLPFRLCNPPPAVGKIRSCGVTPLLEIRLEDVLARQHLPPIGLKDFEEWLLFVELSPENLYFIFWLREYKTRYTQWKSQTEFQSKNASPDFPKSSAQFSSQLAMFYLRAKQTFFTPGSNYELNLATSLLDPFHQPDMSPHPDPSQFIEVELETYRMLEASLRRFVRGQLNNVGNARVLCGMMGGAFFVLVGFFVPIIMNFARGDPRWMRMLSLPGLWFGTFVAFAALNGLCLGVYMFGDLRQLRKFELSRPAISKPQPLPPAYRQLALEKELSNSDSILPVHQSGRDGAPLDRVSSISSEDSHTSDASTSQTISTDDNIHISPAYYDADEVDAMDTSFWGAPSESHFDKTLATPIPPDPFTMTATFIHPFQVASDDPEDLSEALRLPSRHQPMSPFDFDALPGHPTNYRATSRPRPPPLTTNFAALPSQSQSELKSAIAEKIPSRPAPVKPKGFFARVQAKCGLPEWRLQTGFLEAPKLSRKGGQSSPAPHPSSPYWTSHPQHARTPTPTTPKRPSSDSEKTALGEDVEGKVWRRFRLMKAVPAFKAPLTRVLSPAVVRGQWEIVIRAALGALLFAWIVIGLLLAMPRVSR